MVRKITTIQVHEDVKNVLDRMKESDSETYEQVIVKLAERAEKEKRAKEQLMIERYKKYAKDDLKIAKEWEPTELDWD